MFHVPHRCLKAFLYACERTSSGEGGSHNSKPNIPHYSFLLILLAVDQLNSLYDEYTFFPSRFVKPIEPAQILLFSTFSPRFVLFSFL